MSAAPRALLWLGALWTAPNTLVGLLLGLCGLPFGARAHREHMAVVFERYPWGPGGALTLGQAILHTGDGLDHDCLTYASRAARRGDPGCDVERVNLGRHERAHVYQYLALGPLFLPLYLLYGGISARNRFERAADRYASTGRGWWPFGS